MDASRLPSGHPIPLRVSTTVRIDVDTADA